MYKYETPNMTLPLFLTVIPSYILGVLFIWGSFAGFLLLAYAVFAHISMNRIREDNIDYSDAYNNSLIATVVMLLFSPLFYEIAVLVAPIVFIVDAIVVYLSTVDDDLLAEDVISITSLNPGPPACIVFSSIVMMFSDAGFLR